jgi:hypothetical protein
MANIEKTHKRRSKVEPIQPEEGAAAAVEGVKVEEVKPGKPAKAEAGKKPSGPQPKTFFARVAEIRREEWGKRAWIYVYCLEPICNLKMSGESKYLVKSSEPILDEDSIMHDYGSGKYRLMLVYRKPGTDQSDQVDQTEIEIYNPKYPSKIPVSAWLNDSRNDRWAALMPKPAAEKTGQTDLLETLQTFNQIRNDLKEEVKPAPASDDIGKFTGMVNAVASILPKPATTTDNKMLETVVSLLQSQIAASNLEAQQLRTQVFQMITDRKNEKPETSSLDVVKSFINEADTLIPKLKGLFSSATDGVSSVVRRKWWEELLIQAVPPVIQGATPLMQAMAARALAPRQTNGTPPAVAPSTALVPTGAAAPAAALSANDQAAGRLTGFLMANLRPLQMHFDDFLAGKTDEDGELLDGSEFAYWIWQYHGEAPLKDAMLLGTGQILALFRATPYWAAIAPHEEKLTEFINQVLRFEPPPPEAEGAETDLTGGAAAEGASNA